VLNKILKILYTWSSSSNLCWREIYVY